MGDRPIHHVGLIGWPVEHSVSPAMHNAAFNELGLDWHYGLLPTPPDGVEQALRKIGAQGYRGANVTVPHKQAVMPFLDEISSTAQAIGAVNTIVIEEGRLTGHNTDGDGFVAALVEEGFEPAGKRALVLGAGGAARSVVYALAQEGCAITIYNRSEQRAGTLVSDLKLASSMISAVPNLSGLDLGSIDLLVNATSVGMWPALEASPWPGSLPIPSRWTVFDLIYNPPETRLLARSGAAGARVVGGLGMLVHQGALAFEMWTGCPPPLGVMRLAASRALSE